MLELMSKKSLMFYEEAKQGADLNSDSSSKLKGDSFVENSNNGQGFEIDNGDRAELEEGETERDREWEEEERESEREGVKNDFDFAEQSSFM